MFWRASLRKPPKYHTIQIRKAKKAARLLGPGLHPVVASLSGQFEIKLPFLQIGTYHLNFKRIAQLKATATAATDQTVIVLIKLVKVVVQLPHRNHTLTLILYQLHIQAPLADTRNNPLEHLTLMGLQKFHLLVFDRSEERRVGKECRSRWAAYQ